jgi:phosphohistidine phosphatase
MQLYFLRHGMAEEPPDGQRDSQRRLTAEGEADIRALAALLRSIELDPGAIIFSPLVRARQTAVIIAEALDAMDRLVEDERLAHGCGFGELQGIVRGHRHLEALLFVGHQPDMGRFANRLCGQFSISIPPGTLFRIDAEAAEPGGGILKWLLPPSALAGD